MGRCLRRWLRLPADGSGNFCDIGDVQLMARLWLGQSLRGIGETVFLRRFCGVLRLINRQKRSSFTFGAGFAINGPVSGLTLAEEHFAARISRTTET